MTQTETEQQVTPSFVDPTDITKWTDQEIEVLLDGIRFRRMQAHVVYTATLATKERAAKVKLEGLVEKKLEKLQKAMAKADEAFAKLEVVVNEVRALRLQMGEEEL